MRCVSKPATLLGWVAIGCTLLGSSSLGGGAAQYLFQEGEPLPYRMDLLVTNRTSTVAQLFDGAEKSAYQSDVALKLDYQLMPIARETNGDWKMRVALDQAQ